MFVRRHLVRAGGGQAKTAAALRPAIELASQVLLGIVTAVCLVVALTAAAPLLGYRTYTVYGGSMGTSLPRGSLAVTERVDTDGLRVGDVIAMKRHGSTTLHRITSVDIEDGQPVVTTWGDANEGPDAAPVILSGRGDRLMFSVPYLGYLLHFARGPLGRLLLIGVPLIALAVLLWRERAVGQATQAAREPSVADVPEHRSAETAQATASRMPERQIAPVPVAARVAVASASPPPAASELPAFLFDQLRQYRGDYVPLPAPIPFRRRSPGPGVRRQPRLAFERPAA